jgi:integrase
MATARIAAQAPIPGKQASVYIRKKNQAGQWYYERVETGKGHKTGQLQPPYYSRPFTINSKGKRAQVWNQLKAQTFDEAQAEANLGAAALTAKNKGLSIVEAEQVSTGDRVLIKDAVARYLDQKRNKAYRTQVNYKQILNQFVEWLPSHVRFVDQIDDEKENVLDNYMKHLEGAGYEPRTVVNKLSIICFMLKKRRNFTAGIDQPTKILEMPTVEEEDAVPYSPEELRTIFKAADDEERARYQFFLDSACREQEMSVAEWRDIDWTKGKYYVHPKTWANSSGKEKRFTPKTHETRYIPLTREVVCMLKERKADKKNPASLSRWIFPNENGDPDGHHLRKFKKLVYRAGLNCGLCHKDEWGKHENCKTITLSQAGESGCEQHFLHRLRKTCATFWHHQGIPIRNIQKYLGHKSLDTTMKYLGIKESDELQSQLNAPKY